jgi:cell wall-associated NlpC family hydrolase
MTTPQQIDSFLKKKGSPLAGFGNIFVAAGKKYGVDPALTVAISGIESSFGKHSFKPFNAWGWMTSRRWGSWEEGISQVTQGLASGYVREGLTTPEQIVRKYAPASDGNDEQRWTKVVNQFLGELGSRGASGPTPTVGPPPPAGALAGTRPQASTLLDGSDPIAAMARDNLAEIARTGKVSAERQLSRLAGAVAEAEQRAQAWGGTTIAASSQPVKAGQAPPPPPTSTNPQVSRALQIARAQLGKPYVWGAESPETGFDCSGLIEYAFEQAGIKTPGRLTTYSMRNIGRRVPRNQMLPGDWVITNGGKHVVMFMGNGQVIAAPHRGEVVQYQDLSRFDGDIVDIRRFP